MAPKSLADLPTEVLILMLKPLLTISTDATLRLRKTASNTKSALLPGNGLFAVNKRIYAICADIICRQPIDWGTFWSFRRLRLFPHFRHIRVFVDSYKLEKRWPSHNRMVHTLRPCLICGYWTLTFGSQWFGLRWIEYASGCRSMPLQCLTTVQPRESANIKIVSEYSIRLLSEEFKQELVELSKRMVRKKG